ncbi:uncharacterized protein DNG_08278 [Cephalotrichum gorgonifer]|uniref:Uncharacterized protein n=1 Tax=Cephalotrichum gorgonifer TaxID=2041049 RepID=A0AAE8N371_9PEZI|nr:uncharacterized protein DNG_08278 [Cephalotrichum gorgonifer]
MGQTRNSHQYNTFLFQMTISTAHEIVHLFTGYLTGREQNASPGVPNVSGTSDDAGFVFEVQALGGIVAFYSDPQDPDNPHQAGIAYIFPDARDSTSGKRIPQRYIEDFVAGHSVPVNAGFLEWLLGVDTLAVIQVS